MSDNEESFEITPLPLPKLRQWLKPTDYDGDGGEYGRHLASYMANTNEWIFGTTEWTSWHDGPEHGFLRLVGVPGCGKSVMAAHLSNRLAQEGVPVLYFFFRQIIDANHTPQALLRDWLAQLLPMSLPLQLEIDGFISSNRDLGTTSMEDLWKLLRLGLQGQSKVYLVADALDEMDAGNDVFLGALAALGRWKTSNIKVLTTSRPVPSVEQALRHSELTSLQIRLEQGLVDVDIAKYVTDRLANTAIDVDDQARIRQAVPGRASGLFLYARLAMDRFLEPAAVVGDVLAELPLDLDCMYTELLNVHARRAGISRQTQIQVLRWVTHASRPLRLLELAEIMDFSTEPAHRNLKRSKALVRACCGPLIEVLPDETLSVCHHTLTEFLKGYKRSELRSDQYPILDSMSTHVNLATDCLSYLAGGCLSEPKSTNVHLHHGYGPTSTIIPLHMKHPFISYAAHNWNVHVAKAMIHDVPGETVTVLNDSMDRVLQPDLERHNLLELHNPRPEFLSPDMSLPLGGRLHVAASAGLAAYTGKLVSDGMDIDQHDEKGDTPLHCAATAGHTEVMSILLKSGADANAGNKGGYRPIHNAARFNQAKAVALLLHSGVDPMTPMANEPSWVFQDHPYHAKKEPFESRKSRALLGGQSYFSISNGNTPVYYASVGGCVETMNELWPFLTPPQRTRALHWAAESGQDKLVESIIAYAEIGPDVRFEGNTPLYQACKGWQTSVIPVLLRAGADPNAICAGTTEDIRVPGEPGVETAGMRDDSGFTPMHAFASTSGMYSTSVDIELLSSFQALILAGGDTHRRDRFGKTMLHHASKFAKDGNFSTKLAKLLLDAGADANSMDDQGRTPLHICLQNQTKEIRRLLIEHGQADINRSDVNGLSPLLSLLQACQCGGDMSDVIDFLAYGPDCNVVDQEGNTPLHLVLSSSARDMTHYVLHMPLVIALLKAGATADLANREGETPLHVLSFSEPHQGPEVCDFRRQLIELLISHGADINARDHAGKTVLFRQLNRVHVRLNRDDVQMLLDLGSDPNIKDFSGRTLLHALATSDLCGCEGLFDRLVALGLDIDSVDNEGNTVLHEVARVPHLVPFSYIQSIKNINPDSRNHKGQTPLLIACQRSSGDWGNDHTFTLMLKMSQAVNASDHEGVTPLHAASCISQYHVSDLLDAGADVCAVTIEKLTALHFAAMNRQSNVVGVLCDLIASRHPDLIDARDTNGRTPLHYACRSGRLESVATLIRAGASVNAKDRDSLTPLSACAEFEVEQNLWANSSDQSFAIAVSLRSRQTLRTTSPMTNLSLLFDQGHDENYTVKIDEIIELLLTHGADPGLKVDDTGRTVLSDAMDFSCDQGSDYVHGCFLRLRDKLNPGKSTAAQPMLNSLMMEHRLLSSRSAVKDWIDRNESEIDKEMLCHLLYGHHYQPIVDIIKSSRNTAVIEMLKTTLTTGGFATLLDITLERERDIGHEEGHSLPDLKPLLQKACERNISNLDVLGVIVKHLNNQLDGRPPEDSREQSEIQWTKSTTALHYLAVGRNWWQVAEGIPFLLRAGADIEARDEKGQTPLHASLRTDVSGRYQNNATRLLIHQGADVNAVTSMGQTCLSMSSESEVLELLVNHGAKLSVSALFGALHDADLDGLQRLLDLGVDPNTRVGRASADDEGAAPTEHLDWIGPGDSLGSDGLVKSSELYVLDFVARAHKWAKFSRNPDKTPEAIRMLLRYGANPYLKFWAVTSVLNEQDKLVEQTIIHHAFTHARHLSPFLELPDLDVNLRDSLGRTVFLASCCRTDGSDQELTITLNETAVTLSVAEHLLALGSDISATDSSGNNALHLCLGSLGLEELDSLAPLPEGYRPYSFSSRQSISQTISLLLSRAPYLISSPNRAGDAPFHLCFQNHQPFLLELMLASGHVPDPIVPDSKGNTPLHHISRWLGEDESKPFFLRLNDPAGIHRRERHRSRDGELFSRFLDLGCDISATNSEGMTPLASFVSAFAGAMNSRDLENFKRNFRMIVDAGADPKCTTGEKGGGKGLLHLLVGGSEGWTEAMGDHDEEHYRKLDEERKVGRRVEAGSELLESKEKRKGRIGRVFEWLVEDEQKGGVGLDPWMEDAGQRTSLDVAGIMGHKGVVGIFRKEGEEGI